MARLESICFIPHRSSVIDRSVIWSPVSGGNVINGLPQLFWEDGSPWREANLWAQERATSTDVSLKTVQSNITALQSYANWLEETGTKWWDFPLKKSDRCLVRYRGALIRARNEGKVAPSTASQRMAALVRFYRWLYSSGLVSPDWPMWHERVVGIHLVDHVGFTRTVAVKTTDLSIRNRKAVGEKLEDGLLPVSVKDCDSLLLFAKENASEELFLMLSLGFFTGMRLGTLTDLRIETLDHAMPDSSGEELYRLWVGPGASPPVHTKGDVTDYIHITRTHLDALREYFYSVRRLTRQALASPKNRNLVFLTRFGNPYSSRGSDKSPAINVEMHALRARGTSQGVEVLRHFHFHQTRCTFATELARLAISAGGAINAVAIVKEFLLHKLEQTALRYIKFVEKTPIKEEAANAFTRSFLGVVNRRGGAANA